MRRIGILTLCGYINYGNRLQNYATQEVLKSLGFEVETITNHVSLQKESIGQRIINRMIYLRKANVSEINNYIKCQLWNVFHKNVVERRNIERIEIFRKFSKDHITETEYSISPEEIPDDLADRYDYFVCGSDQVWNPFYNNGSSMFFLSFAPISKRVAYSPSFGVSDIPILYLSNYEKWISEIKWISVREEAGAKIIKKLTGRDAKVLIDPTLMLTKEKWLSMSRKSENKPARKYLLAYFLGEETNKNRIRIKEIAKKNGLIIVRLADVRVDDEFQSGPAEFIDYMHSASIVCTDSFHGAAFSILMEIPFIVFEREGNTQSMSARNETLLRKFNMESRKSNKVITNEQSFTIDFSQVPSILEIERKRALEYLKEALDVTEENSHNDRKNDE